MKIYDAVHGFIRFNELEAELINSFPFQRLHYIHQLGISYLVYPGGTHTRFEHSLGVMELASLIFDRLTLDHPLPGDREYWRQILRLAALSHDLGHLPFSHVAEKALLGKGGHERWTLEVIKSSYFKPILTKLAQRYPLQKDVALDLIKIALGEKKLREVDLDVSLSPWEKVVTEILTGDFFGADRIDYLLRDARCTGVAYGLIDYHQLIEMLRILPIGDHLSLGIEENGLESCEALLLARHFMHRRVYQYATAKAYSFHLIRFMQLRYGNQTQVNLEHYLGMTDNEVLSDIARAAKDTSEKGHADALALHLRHRRFKAIELPANIEDSQLETFKKQFVISSDSIVWERSVQKRNKMGLSFPVLKKNGVICDAGSCSEISIPSGPAGWIYISPEFEKVLQQFLLDQV